MTHRRRRPDVRLFLLPALLFASSVFAQSRPSLSLRLVAGQPRLTVTGDVGSPCTIQYATGVVASAWIPLTNVTLVSSSAVLVDSSGSLTNQRFYRALISVSTNLNWVPAGSFVMGS